MGTEEYKLFNQQELNKGKTLKQRESLYFLSKLWCSWGNIVIGMF